MYINDEQGYCRRKKTAAEGRLQLEDPKEPAVPAPLEQNRTERNRTEQSRAGQGRAEQNRIYLLHLKKSNPYSFCTGVNTH